MQREATGRGVIGIGEIEIEETGVIEIGRGTGRMIDIEKIDMKSRVGTMTRSEAVIGITEIGIGSTSQSRELKA